MFLLLFHVGVPGQQPGELVNVFAVFESLQVNIIRGFILSQVPNRTDVCVAYEFPFALLSS